jgi:hypothetical protein
VWNTVRPRVSVSLAIDDGVSTYLLTPSSDKGWGQRRALEDAAQALALPIVLLDSAPEADASDAAMAQTDQSAPARLEGRMTITPAGYWNTDWRFRSEGTDERFATNGVTFDAAIGEALRRSAKALAKL